MHRSVIHLIRLGLCLLAMGLVFSSPALAAVSPTAAFDEANRLFEQGRYGAAADAYELLWKEGQTTVAVLFNLGNARFRNGEIGRAVGAYLHARRLAPRDAGVQANLLLARRSVHGAEDTVLPLRQRILGLLTPTEWAWLTSVFGWLFFLLLCAREWRPLLSTRFRLLTRFCGIGLVLMAGAWFTVASEATKAVAVVVVKDAPVRFTPLEESPVSFNAPDGFELEVLGLKAGGQPNDDWLEVKDPSGRVGWVRGRAVVQVGRF